jgi:hypothetical protein
MVMVAIYGLRGSGLPDLMEISPMMVSREWLPVCDAEDLQLVARLVSENRAFIKSMINIHHQGDGVPLGKLAGTRAVESGLAT